MSETRPQRRGGLLGGLVLATLGAVLLLRNLGAIDNLWEMMGRYWPLLLILLGLAKIVEYMMGTAGRLLRFGEFVLILFIILIGSVASRLPLQLRVPFADRVRVGQPLGSSFSFSEEKTQSVTSTPSLQVRNAQGNVTVLPGIEGQIKVKVDKLVYAKDERAARDVADRIRLDIVAQESGWLVDTKGAGLQGDEGRYETSLEIYVPPTANLNVVNSNGDVRLEGLAGNHTLYTSYGLLSLTRLRGDVTGTNKYGDTRVSGIEGNLQLECLRGRAVAERVAGDLNITNAYGTIEVSDVGGRAVIHNSYGTVTARNLKKGGEIIAPGSPISADGVEGPLKIRSSHKEVIIDNSTTRVELEQEYGSVRAVNIGGDLVAKASYTTLYGSGIRGSVNIEGSNAEVELENVLGNADIQNRFKPVTLIDFGGSVRIQNENGAVTLVATAAPSHPITAVASYGNVELSLPGGSAFRVEAKSRAGEVDSEFEGLDEGRESGDVRTLRGQVAGGGPLVKLETSYSNISLRRSSSQR